MKLYFSCFALSALLVLTSCTGSKKSSTVTDYGESEEFSSISAPEFEEYAKELARSIAISYEEGRT